MKLFVIRLCFVLLAIPPMVAVTYPVVAGGCDQKAGSGCCTSSLAIPLQLQQQTVFLEGNKHQGTGVFFTTKDHQVWVLTCAHVVAGVKKDKGFDDMNVTPLLMEGGRKVGEMKLAAEVIRFSGRPPKGEDIALLRIRSKSFRAPVSAKFYLEGRSPDPGTEVYHCGCLDGSTAPQALSSGLIAGLDRTFHERLVDQTSALATYGSSGGGVYLKSDGRYLGMVEGGQPHAIVWYIPARRILAWADRVGVRFVFDAKVAPVTDADLRKKLIEEAP